MRWWTLHRVCALLGAFGAVSPSVETAAQSASGGLTFSDAHFHLTNYVQRGTDLRVFLGMLGTRVHRVALFGLPLQQQWSHGIDGATAPTYYLHSDAPLYYYSFTDAQIATAYLALPPAERARFDPMITGFNPGDMYAADHIRRVLRIFPGVFTGIGEFTIHKEFVSAKTAGGPASLIDPALDSIFALAGEVGLVVLLHSDVDVPFAPGGAQPAYLDQLRALFARHPHTTIIWAHTGVGRVVRPVTRHLQMIESLIRDPALAHLHFDISWDVVARYIVASDTTVAATAALLNRYPGRFLFGTDVVAPDREAQYFAVFELYKPLLERLTPEARSQLLRTNYDRLFGTARQRVREWENRDRMTNGTTSTIR
jgi:predicted TIM-barrel fold metal-dependent hydrolase